MQESPLLVVLLEFYAIILIVALALLVWVIEHLKRLRLVDATRQLEKIFSMTAEAVKEHSSEKLESVNKLIELWDQAHAKEFGAHIGKLSWS